MGGTVVAAVWAVAGRWIFRLLGLISTLVLARFLAPEDFGLVAIAVSILAVFDALSDFNFAAALVKFRDADNDEYHTAWNFNVIRGAVLALVLAVGAPFFASMFDDGRLESVFQVMAVTVFVRGFVSIKMVDFVKYLSLDKEFIFRTVTKLVSISATITLAILYKSYWALVVGGLIEAIFQLGFSYILAPYRPRLYFKAYRRLLSFSGGLMIISVLQTLWMRAEQFALGYFLPARFVGLYKIGQEVGSMPVGELSAPLMRAFFPALTYVQDDRAEFSRLIHETANILTILMLPAGLGFALVAKDLIVLAIGEKWLPSVPIVQTFAIVQSVAIVLLAPQYGLRALGRLKILIVREVFTVCVMAISVIIGVIYWGLWGALVARVLTELLRNGFALWMVRKYAGFQTRRLVQGSWRGLCATAVMGAVVFSIDFVMTRYEPSVAASALVSIQVIAGVISYSGVLLMLWSICGKPMGPEAFLLEKFSAVVGKIKAIYAG